MRRRKKGVKTEQKQKKFVIWYHDLRNPQEEFRAFLQRHFTDDGIRHQEFENKTALLAALKTKQQPDLLLTHLQLHNDFDAQPGIKLVKSLRQSYPDLKIVIFSARGDESLQEDLAGIADYYLNKAQLWELELIIVCLVLGYDFKKITRILTEIKNKKKMSFITELERLHELLKKGSFSHKVRW